MPPKDCLAPKCFLKRHLTGYYCYLILRKITKFVATRCQILRPKCTKFNFGWSSAPHPAGGAYSAPGPLAGFKGPTPKKREGKAMEWKSKGKGREGKDREVKEGRRRREENEGAPIEMMPPNENPIYATGATAIHLLSPVLIYNHNIRH